MRVRARASGSIFPFARTHARAKRRRRLRRRRRRWRACAGADGRCGTTPPPSNASATCRAGMLKPAAASAYTANAARQRARQPRHTHQPIINPPKTHRERARGRVWMKITHTTLARTGDRHLESSHTSSESVRICLTKINYAYLSTLNADTLNSVQPCAGQNTTTTKNTVIEFVLTCVCVCVLISGRYECCLRADLLSTLIQLECV